MESSRHSFRGTLTLLLGPGQWKPHLPVSACGCVQLIDKMSQPLIISSHPVLWLEPQRRVTLSCCKGQAWMGKEQQEALGITITDVVFKAMSVRSADPSPGGRKGKSNTC